MNKKLQEIISFNKTGLGFSTTDISLSLGRTFMINDNLETNAGEVQQSSERTSARPAERRSDGSDTTTIS